MDRFTGKPLSGLEHLRQSLIDILTTRVGERVMLRDYGSQLPNLIDNPTNPFFGVDLFMAIAQACQKWEPRLKLEHIAFKPLGGGKVEVELDALYLPQAKNIRLSGLMIK